MKAVTATQHYYRDIQPWLDVGKFGDPAYDDAELLILTGGADVDPHLYQEEPEPYTTYAPRRDGMEMLRLKFWLESGRKVLGICRGLQLLNVYFGGTLFQDIPNHVSGRHPATFSEYLPPYFHQLGTVNSYHHQAIKTLGKG